MSRRDRIGEGFREFAFQAMVLLAAAGVLAFIYGVYNLAVTEAAKR